MINSQIVHKIHVGVRRNAVNMKMAIDTCRRRRCWPRVPQFTVNFAQCLLMQTSVEAVFKKACTIVSHFKHSERACRHLVGQQKMVKFSEHCLLQDFDKRWNSAYLMTGWVVEQCKAINLYSMAVSIVCQLQSGKLGTG